MYGDYCILYFELTEDNHAKTWLNIYMHIYIYPYSGVPLIFFHIIKKPPHSSTATMRYGVSLDYQNPDLYSASVFAVIHAVYC